MEQYTNYAVEQTCALLAIDSPSGFTHNAAEYAVNEFKKLGFDPVLTRKGGVLVCLLSKAWGDQYLVYGLGNLLSLAALLLLNAWGKEETRKDALRSIAFALVTALLMQLGRAIVALALGNGLLLSLGFFTTGVITDLFTVVVVWISRRLDGIFEDQIHYLLRIQKESQKG